jgi:hypothetical protein
MLYFILRIWVIRRSNLILFQILLQIIKVLELKKKSLIRPWAESRFYLKTGPPGRSLEWPSAAQLAIPYPDSQLDPTWDRHCNPVGLAVIEAKSFTRNYPLLHFDQSFPVLIHLRDKMSRSPHPLRLSTKSPINSELNRSNLDLQHAKP